MPLVNMCNQTLKVFIPNIISRFFITVLSYGWYLLGRSNGSDIIYDDMSLDSARPFSYIQFLLPANLVTLGH
jgi:hypothetical protein